MKILAIILPALLPLLALGQEAEPATKTQLTADLGFSGLQFGAELKTAKTQTAQFRAGLLPLFYTETSYFGGGGTEMDLVGSIALSAEYRFYYNFSKRLEKGKDIRNNGANFFSLFVMYGSRPVIGKSDLGVPSTIFMAGPMWGFNRALGERFVFNLTLGPVYQKNRQMNTTGGSLWADLRWSYIIK